MKKISKILITTGIIFLTLWGCKNTTQTCTTPTPSSVVDTTKYTDVVLINKSGLDSVQVFVTLSNMNSIIGKFGMDSSDIVTYCAPDSIPCVGNFWAKKGVQYHLGDTTALPAVVITWGIQNQACTSAQSIVDSKGRQLYPFGLNIFEFSVNTWWQKGKVTGNGESFDISCVDGLHCVLQQSVTSFGPRNTDGLNPNFGAFWDFGYKDSTQQLVKFTNSSNGVFLRGCVDIAGIFPYGCDWGYKSEQPPTPCSNPTYSVTCSTKWGQINSSQTNRQGQGGQIICEFLGFTYGAEPAEK